MEAKRKGQSISLLTEACNSVCVPPRRALRTQTSISDFATDGRRISETQKGETEAERVLLAEGLISDHPKGLYHARGSTKKTFANPARATGEAGRNSDKFDYETRSRLAKKNTRTEIDWLHLQWTASLRVSSMAEPGMFVFSARQVISLVWSEAFGWNWIRETVVDSPSSSLENWK